jgi:hypothetical protein
VPALVSGTAETVEIIAKFRSLFANSEYTPSPGARSGAWPIKAVRVAAFHGLSDGSAMSGEPAREVGEPPRHLLRNEPARLRLDSLSPLVR